MKDYIIRQNCTKKVASQETTSNGCGGGTRTSRPPGYEPGKLPTAPLRDVGSDLNLVLVTGLEPVRILLRRILSPLRLPVPPHEHFQALKDNNIKTVVCQTLFEKGKNNTFALTF